MIKPKKKQKRQKGNDKYYSTMERVAKENYKKWGYKNENEALIAALNDNTYNYKLFYKDNPKATNNADTHWPDTYKTVYHPTFSEESIYSGIPSQYNPKGIIGGRWMPGSDDHFMPSLEQSLPTFRRWDKGKDVELNIVDYADPDLGQYARVNPETGDVMGMSGNVGSIVLPEANIVGDIRNTRMYKTHELYRKDKPLELDNSWFFAAAPAAKGLKLASVVGTKVLPAIGKGVVKVLTNPYANAAVDSYFLSDLAHRIGSGEAGKGVKDLVQNGQVTEDLAYDLLDVAGVTSTATKIPEMWRNVSRFGSENFAKLDRAMRPTYINPESLRAQGFVNYEHPEGSYAPMSVYIPQPTVSNATPEEIAGLAKLEDRVSSKIMQPTTSNISDAERMGLTKHERKGNRPNDPRPIVNEDGTINPRALALAYGLVKQDYRYGDNFRKGLRSVLSSDFKPLYLHLKGVVETAQQIPVPLGSTRAELVRAALVHDIGKTAREEYAPHGLRSVDMLYKFIHDHPKEFREFNNKKILNAVRDHMPENVVGEFGENTPYKNFVGALRAADIGRGMTLEKLGADFPYTMLYKHNGSAPKFFTGTDEEQILAANRWLRNQGYPLIPKGSSMQEARMHLLKIAERHNLFFRGVMPPGYSEYRSVQQNELNAKNSKESAMRYYGADDELSQMKASTVSIPLAPTGSGRASLFHVVDDYATKLSKHKSSSVSNALGINPKTQDGLYVSATPEVMDIYAEEKGIGSIVRMPFEPIRDDEPLMLFINRADYQLMDALAIGGKRPGAMSDYLLFSVPYLQQTGRPFSTDFNNWALQKAKREGTIRYEKQNIPVMDLSDTKKAEDVKHAFESTKRVIESARDAETSENLLNGMLDLRFVPTGYERYLSDIRRLYTTKFLDNTLAQYATQKQSKYWTNLTNQEQSLRSYRYNAKNKNQKNWANLRLEEVREKKDELRDAIAKLIKRQYNNDKYYHFDVKNGNRSAIKERPIFDTSLERKIEFMKEKGVAPAYMFPNFGDRIMIQSSGTSFGKGVASRNVNAKGTSDPQAYVIGKKGQKVFDIIEDVPKEDRLTLIKEANKATKNSSKKKRRNGGKRYIGEGKYAITRKTYDKGKNPIIKPLRKL